MSEGTLYREGLTRVLSNQTSLSVESVRLLIQQYTAMIKDDIQAGETTRFLTICRFLPTKQPFIAGSMETLYHQACRLSEWSGVQERSVEVFLEYLDFEISKLVSRGETVVVNGLLKITPKDGRVYLTTSEMLRTKGVSVRIARDPRLERKVLVAS